MSVVADRPEAVPAAQPLTRVTGPIRVNEPWRSGIHHRLRELVSDARMIPYYGKQYIQRRYRNTWLGWIWLPLRPILTVASQVLFFGSFLQVGGGDRPYIIFFTFGSAGWILFERMMFWSNRSMRISKTFVRNAQAPALPRVFAVVFAAAVDFLLAVWIALAAVVYYWVVRGHLYLVPSKTTLIGFLGIGLLALWGFAVGLWIAPFSLYTRDVRYSFVYVMQFLYVVTPVIYPVSKLPAKWRPIAEYNPLTAPIEMVKYGFLQTNAPRPISLIISLTALAVILVGGLWSFNRFERKLIERS
jgi:lipopolysaccharide transport system permease protein